MTQYEEQPPFRQWPNDAGFNASAEILEAVELTIHGRIPRCVSGMLYRTGPSDYKVDDTQNGQFKLSHWFGRLGIQDILVAQNDGSCKVLYKSRNQVDALIEKVRKTGKLNGITFGQKRDPCSGFFQKIKSIFEPIRNEDIYMSNIGVTISSNPSGIQGKFNLLPGEKEKPPGFMVLKTDNSQMKYIDMETLEPLGLTNQLELHPDLKGPLSCAHPQYDPENGDVFNYNLDFGGPVASYRVFKTSLATGSTEILALISDTSIASAYLHSFFLTGDFVILAIWASHFSGYGLSILWQRNILDVIAPFKAEAKVKWIVVDRRHGNGVVATFDSPAAFSFHSVNAWQEQRNDHDSEVDIYCDVIQYASLDVLHRLYYDNLVSTGPGVAKFAGANNDSTAPSLIRYRLAKIPTGPEKVYTKSTSPAEILLQARAPLVGDLPTINPDFSTKKSRYVYSIVDQGKSSWLDSISKFDSLTRDVLYWEKRNHTPGEAIFIPDPDRTGEDAGFLLSVILNGDTGTSYLLCLDAATMKEVGRAEAEVAIGFGSHSEHLPQT